MAAVLWCGTGIPVDLLFVSLSSYETLPPYGKLDLLAEDHIRHLDEQGELDTDWEMRT